MLATLGREGDITIEGPTVSPIQCSFQINPLSNEILLCDNSSNKSIDTNGGPSVTYDPARQPRRVVIRHGVNNIFKASSSKNEYVHFEIIWHPYAVELRDQISFSRLRRDPTPVDQTIMTRHFRTKELGSGAFGTVHPTIDIDSGDILAVKVVKFPSDPISYQNARREVEILSGLCHVSPTNGVRSLSANALSQIWSSIEDLNSFPPLPPPKKITFRTTGFRKWRSSHALNRAASTT